jgi:hypothetical protein
LRLLDGVIGTATGIFERGGNVERIREVAIGDLTAGDHAATDGRIDDVTFPDA